MNLFKIKFSYLIGKIYFFNINIIVTHYLFIKFKIISVLAKLKLKLKAKI